MEVKSKRRPVLAASLFINIFVGSIYAWSVFAGALGQAFGWSAAAVALTFTIANGISPVTMITGGKLLDRYGPRWVVFAGGLMFGGGMIASGFISSIVALYVTYGIFVGFGMGMVYSCTIANTVKFFPDKKGLVSGLSTGAYGLSSVIFAPAAQRLIEIIGVMNTFKVIGAAALIVVCCCSQLLKKAPEQTDEGNEALPLQRNNGDSLRASLNGTMDSGGYRDFTWREMLKTGDFYLLVSMLIVGATAGLMIISQASPIAQEVVGITPAMAALTVSLISLANAAGRIIWGFIADRIGNHTTLPILFIILVASLFSLMGAGADRRVLFFLPVMLIGFCFGGFMAVFPAITTERFGMKYNGANYGVMFCGFAIGGFLGPKFAATFRITQMGPYVMAFIVAGVMCAAGIVLALIAKRRSKMLKQG